LPVELLKTQYVRNASKVMPVRIDREDALRPAGVISQPASEGPDRRFNVWRRYDSALTVGVETALRSNRRFVARISSRAKSARRMHFHERRTYSGRPSFNMRFSEATAMATSIVCRPSVRERSASPITRL
jgi:hypothetical protein